MGFSTLFCSFLRDAEAYEGASGCGGQTLHGQMFLRGHECPPKSCKRELLCPGTSQFGCTPRDAEVRTGLMSLTQAINRVYRLIQQVEPVLTFPQKHKFALFCENFCTWAFEWEHCFTIGYSGEHSLIKLYYCRSPK